MLHVKTHEDENDTGASEDHLNGRGRLIPSPVSDLVESGFETILTGAVFIVIYLSPLQQIFSPKTCLVVSRTR